MSGSRVFMRKMAQAGPGGGTATRTVIGENMGEREQDVERTRHDPEHMLEMAWGIIANASDWRMSEEGFSKSDEWVEAAERWRDNYHEWLQEDKALTKLAQIVTLLIAGDIQARIVSNEEADFVEIKMTDGGGVLWNRDSGPWWSFTILDREGQLGNARVTGLASDAAPEEVAKLMATYQYPAPAEYPTADPVEDPPSPS